MRDEPARASSRRVGRALLWTECLLIGSGAALLVWVGLLLADARMTQHLAREALAAARPPNGFSSTATVVPARPRVINRGAPIGELSIPRVQLSAMVLQGSDTRTLRRGPGHIENTSLPGQPGNIAIAGHRDTFFRPIRNLRVGDDIFLDTFDGRFHYRVASLGVVPPDDVSVLDTTPSTTLTLITCYPFWVAGPAPNRFIVRASEVTSPDTGTAVASERRVTAVEQSSVALERAPWEPPSAGRMLPVERHAATIGVAGSERDAARDELLVREVVERFRLTYNARLAARREGGLLSLNGCRVTVSEDDATATCADASPAPDAPSAWVFALRSANGTWAIASVEPR